MVAMPPCHHATMPPCHMPPYAARRPGAPPWCTSSYEGGSNGVPRLRGTGRLSSLLLVTGGQVGLVLDLQLDGVLYLLECLVGLLPGLQHSLGDTGELGVRDLHLLGVLVQTGDGVVGSYHHLAVIVHLLLRARPAPAGLARPLAALPLPPLLLVGTGASGGELAQGELPGEGLLVGHPLL